jgi:hypothetical protein
MDFDRDSPEETGSISSEESETSKIVVPFNVVFTEDVPSNGEVIKLLYLHNPNPNPSISYEDYQRYEYRKSLRDLLVNNPSCFGNDKNADSNMDEVD